MSHAIALLVERMMPAGGTASNGFTGRRLYYYTRSTHDPVPYWHHVRDYRAAHQIW